MMEINPIPNMVVYTNGMDLSIGDKLFFLDYCNDFTTIVDYGCANGELLSKVHEKYNFELIGFDHSPEMVELANNKVGGFATITNNWDQVIEMIKGKDAILNLSSVIHEVYAYCDEREIYEFWHKVYNSGFKYVIVRDMLVTKRITDIVDFGLDIQKIQATTNLTNLYSFTQRWGDFDNYQTLLHFLLKYRYIDNWSHELHENYLGLYYEDFEKLTPNNYKPVHIEHFKIPFLENELKNDFNINFRVPTHSKYILKLK